MKTQTCWLQWKASCVERKASAQSGRQHRIESNNPKHRNNYFTWGRILFWMFICASIRWYHLFSQELAWCKLRNPLFSQKWVNLYHLKGFDYIDTVAFGSLAAGLSYYLHTITMKAWLDNLEHFLYYKH